jgi:hypothetical protein
MLLVNTRLSPGADQAKRQTVSTALIASRKFWPGIILK